MGSDNGDSGFSDMDGNPSVEPPPAEADPTLEVISFFADNEYLFGTQFDEPDCVDPGHVGVRPGAHGIEFGNFRVTDLGELIASIPAPVPGKAYADSNAYCGLVEKAPQGEHATNDRYFLRPQQNGEILIIQYDPGAFEGGLDQTQASGDFGYMVLRRMPSEQGGLVGSWKLKSSWLRAPSTASSAASTRSTRRNSSA